MGLALSWMLPAGGRGHSSAARASPFWQALVAWLWLDSSAPFQHRQAPLLSELGAPEGPLTPSPALTPLTSLPSLTPSPVSPPAGPAPQGGGYQAQGGLPGGGGGGLCMGAGRGGDGGARRRRALQGEKGSQLAEAPFSTAGQQAPAGCPATPCSCSCSCSCASAGAVAGGPAVHAQRAFSSLCFAAQRLAAKSALGLSSVSQSWAGMLEFCFKFCPPLPPALQILMLNLAKPPPTEEEVKWKKGEHAWPGRILQPRCESAAVRRHRAAQSR